MTNEAKVSKWLRENTDLSETRTSGDTPAIKFDRLYLNRSELYEIRDFILKYYECCNIKHKDDNYEITFKKIMNFKKGEKVKTEIMLDALKEKHEKC